MLQSRGEETYGVLHPAHTVVKVSTDGQVVTQATHVSRTLRETSVTPSCLSVPGVPPPGVSLDFFLTVQPKYGVWSRGRNRGCLVRVEGGESHHLETYTHREKDLTRI